MNPVNSACHAKFAFKYRAVCARQQLAALSRRRAGRPVFPGQRRNHAEKLAVITSYSIHYTKLYDPHAGRNGDEIRPGRNQRRRIVHGDTANRDAGDFHAFLPDLEQFGAGLHSAVLP